MRIFRWITAGLVVVACGAASAPAAAPGPVRVGVLLALSGSAATYGRRELAAVRLAHRLSGQVLGRGVKLFVADTGSDPETARRAIRKLIARHRVAAVIGPTLSPVALAVGPIADRHRVPLITPSATAPAVTRHRRYVFRACFADPWQGWAAARFAADRLHARRAAMIVDVTQPYSVSLARAFAREFTRPRALFIRVSIFSGYRVFWTRGRIISRMFFQSGDQEFVGQIQTVARRRPDVLYLPNYAPENTLIAIQVRRRKMRGPGDRVFKVTIIGGDASRSRDLIEEAGIAVQKFHHGRRGKKFYPGFVVTAHFDPREATSQRARAFLAAFKKRYEGRRVSTWHALGADAYFLLLDAMKRAGSVQGARVRRALIRTREFRGLTGRLIMTPTGDPKKSVVILEVSGDKFVYLTTVQP